MSTIGVGHITIALEVSDTISLLVKRIVDAKLDPKSAQLPHSLFPDPVPARFSNITYGNHETQSRGL